MSTENLLDLLHGMWYNVYESEGDAMKKIKGTRYAHVGATYHPTLLKYIDKLEATAIKQLTEVEEMIRRAHKLAEGR